MLSHDDAIGLLSEYGKGAAWTRHCFAVADAAVGVASLLEGRHGIDMDALWPAALLHDIGRYVTHDPILHGVEGYHLLMRLGHEEAAFICASHVLFGLDATDAARFGLPGRDFVPRTYEERIVPLVDFLIDGDQPTTLDLRFSSLRERNADNCLFLSRLNRAQEEAASFMMQVSEELGESVERLVAFRARCSQPTDRMP